VCSASASYSFQVQRRTMHATLVILVLNLPPLSTIVIHRIHPSIETDSITGSDRSLYSCIFVWLLVQYIFLSENLTEEFVCHLTTISTDATKNDRTQTFWTNVHFVLQTVKVELGYDICVIIYLQIKVAPFYSRWSYIPRCLCNSIQNVYSLAVIRWL